MYNTHRDFDGYFYRKKSAHYTRVNTVVILNYSWIEIENVSSVDYLTQANKDQLLLGFCYFLCCVFNVCKLGSAWQ